MSTGTNSLADLAHHPWDAIVIGAGPAGSVAAHQLATRGLHTLLVDARVFPRHKACGGCLNCRALEVLESIGLDRVLESCHATPIRGLRLIVGRRESRLSLPPGLGIVRESFDLALVQAAVRAGASFVDGTQALVEPKLDRNVRLITLVRHGEREVFQARVVVCADGLSRSSLKRIPEITSLVVRLSRIGVGTTLRGDSGAMTRDEITMAVGSGGYVGMAHCGDGELNIAAAINPDCLARRATSDVVASALRNAGIEPSADIGTASWHGTPPLTSRPNRVAGERLFLIGDAGGYVEPFSGEGMAAAMESAVAVAPLVLQAVTDWHSSLAKEWERRHRRLVYDQQATCRQLAWIWRRPWAATAAMTVCRVSPRMANRFIARVS